MIYFGQKGGKGDTLASPVDDERHMVCYPQVTVFGAPGKGHGDNSTV